MLQIKPEKELEKVWDFVQCNNTSVFPLNKLHFSTKRRRIGQNNNEKRSKNKRQTSKKLSAFTSAFARCELALNIAIESTFFIRSIDSIRMPQGCACLSVRIIPLCKT